MVDFLRSCYRTECRFFSDDPRTSTIQWFFCDDDAEDLGFGTAFTSNVWLDVPEGDQELGEVPGADRFWRDGRPPYPVGGVSPCGSQEVFQLGDFFPPEPPIEVNDWGGLACCELPTSPFVGFSCIAWPDGVYDTYTLIVHGATGVWANCNGTYDMRFGARLGGLCAWVSQVDFTLDVPHLLYHWEMAEIWRNWPPDRSLACVAPASSSGFYYPLDTFWDPLEVSVLPVRFQFGPLTGVPTTVTLVPGLISVPGLFCLNQGVFLPTNLGIRVRNVGPGLLSSIVNQTIPLTQTSGCIYRGRCWFTNAVLRFRFEIGVTCELRFLAGGIIEFAGQSPRGAPFFYSAQPAVPWDGSPIALMLDQPVPPFLGLPQSITLFTQGDLPP